MSTETPPGEQEQQQEAQVHLQDQDQEKPPPAARHSPTPTFSHRARPQRKQALQAAARFPAAAPTQEESGGKILCRGRSATGALAERLCARRLWARRLPAWAQRLAPRPSYRRLVFHIVQAQVQAQMQVRPSARA
ncbi:hypothetical protein HDU86_003366 [Geranomyces michiganensis]|nr:hypothetical protein HDU86_003366 [Geranomyces michiganensis]